MKQLSKKQQEMNEKRELIFKTSISLFKKYGYDNVTIKDICKETNISTGSLYNMYKNKADILNEFHNLFEKNCYKVLKNIKTSDGLDVIYNYIYAILNTFEYIGSDLTLVLHPSYDRLFTPRSDGTIILEQYLQELKNANIVITDYSAEQCVEMINIIINGLIFNWCHHKNRYKLIEDTKKILPGLLNFLNH